MNKTIVIVALCIFPFLIQAQEGKNGGIKINPLGLFVQIVTISYEQTLTEKNSAQLGVSFINTGLGGTEISGFGVTPEFRLYTKRALNGFYFAPIMSFSSFSAEDDINKIDVNSFGGGAKLGWNWLLGSTDSFIIDLGLGAQYSSIRVEAISGSSDEIDLARAEGILPVINFSLGYAFGRKEN